MKLRPYQVEAVSNVFRIFGIPPAGPTDEPVVKHYRDRERGGPIDIDGGSNGAREHGQDGGNRQPLADRPSDDDSTPI